ncbi:MAG: DUF2141 domain-containing protein [Parvularculaceae bacterium]|nr:DUF2141 domain-containing protein [Parvularculaceae bacterium]
MVAALLLGVAPAGADSMPTPNPLAGLTSDDAVVLAVKSEAPAGKEVRLTVYDNPSTFLEIPASRHHATVGSDGLAIVKVDGLKAGEYAIVAYLDENGDGRLNRNALGKPKEPFIFSNDVKPKLKKPSFDETKVSVGPGEVVVLTLKG